LIAAHDSCLVAPKQHQMLFVQPRRYNGCEDMSACAFVDDLALQISLKSVSNVQSVSSIKTNIKKWRKCCGL